MHARHACAQRLTFCRQFWFWDEQVFQLFDEDGNGAITAEDLRRCLGDFVPRERLEGMIQEADFSGDGAVDKEEWMHVMLGTTPDFGDPLELIDMMGAAMQFDVND